MATNTENKHGYRGFNMSGDTASLKTRTPLDISEKQMPKMWNNQAQQVENNPFRGREKLQDYRMSKGIAVVRLAAEAYGQPIAPMDFYRNTRSGDRRCLWEFGKILDSNQSGDVVAAAHKLAEGLERGVLEFVSKGIEEKSLDDFKGA